MPNIHETVAQLKELDLYAGGPGSGRRPDDLSYELPTQNIIDQRHKHLYTITTKRNPHARFSTLDTVHVSGNSAAEASRNFKSRYPSARGGQHAKHVATKASDGTWRSPTVSVLPRSQGTFGAIPVDKWQPYSISN